MHETVACIIMHASRHLRTRWLIHLRAVHASVNLNDRVWNLKHTKDNGHTSWYARNFFGLSDGRMDYNQRLTMYGQNDMRSTTAKYTDGQQTNWRTVVKLRTNMCWRKTGRQRMDGQIRGRTDRQRTDGRADWRLTMYGQNDKHWTTDGQICFSCVYHLPALKSPIYCN